MSARLNDPRFLQLHLPLNGHGQDVSGHNRHGTWGGTEAYAEGLKGIQEGDFEGTNSSLDCGPVAGTLLEGAQDFTISCWFLTRVGGLKSLAGTHAGSDFNAGWSITHNGADLLFVADNNSASPWALVYTASSYVQQDELIFMTLTRTGNVFQFYKNGEPFDGGVTNSVTIGAGVFNLQVGSSGDERHWDGSIGGMRIYNISLTLVEVKKLFLQTAPRQVVAEQPIPQAPDLADSSLKGSWLNKLVTGTPDDASTEGNDLTSVGAPVMERVGAKFDGAADYLLKTVANWQSGDSLGTITAWVKRTAAGSFRSTIWMSADTGSSARYLQFGIREADDKLDISQRDSDTAVSVKGGTSIVVGEWYHVAVTSDGTVYKLYVNGSLESLVIVSGVNNGDWLADTTLRDDVVIGAAKWNSTTQYFPGEIRDVRYYSDEKTADYLLNESRKGVPDSNLVLNVMGDGLDRSPYRQVLVPQDDAIVGRRMKFDGADDYLHETVTSWRTNDSRGTICAWIKRASVSSEVVIFASSNLNGLNVVRFLSLSTGEIGIIQRANDSPDGVRGDTQLAADRWYHIAVTSDGSAWKIYVNGVEEALTLISGGNTGDWFDAASRNNITIGAWRHAVTASPYDGEIDDVRAYSDEKSVDWFKDYHLRTRKFY